MKKINKSIITIFILINFLFINSSYISHDFIFVNNGKTDIISTQDNRLKKESYSLPKLIRLRVKNVNKEEIRNNFNYLFINSYCSIIIFKKLKGEISFKPFNILVKSNKEKYIEKDDF